MAAAPRPASPIVACVAVLAAALSSGCVSRLGDFSLLTNQNVGQVVDLSKATLVGEFEGSDSRPIILVFPTGTPNAEDALDEALRAGGGHVMTDAVAHYSWFYIPYLVGEERITIKGKVWKLAGLPALPPKEEEKKEPRNNWQQRQRNRPPSPGN